MTVKSNLKNYINVLPNVQDHEILFGDVFACLKSIKDNSLRSVYCSIFMLLGIALRKALLWGTLLVLYEQALGVLVTFVGGPALSLSGHILSVGTSFLNYSHPIPGWTVTMSAQLLAIVTIACILLSMLLFRMKDLS